VYSTREKKSFWSPSGPTCRHPLRKPVVVGVTLLGLFFLLLRCFPSHTAAQIGADEGFELAKATLCLHGHKLYSEVWNDQPPLHTFLVNQLIQFQSVRQSSSTGRQVAGELARTPAPSVLGPRLLTTVCSAVLLLTIFGMVCRFSGTLCATLTTALLIVPPGFLELTSSCMLGSRDRSETLMVPISNLGHAQH